VRCRAARCTKKLANGYPAQRRPTQASRPPLLRVRQSVPLPAKVPASPWAAQHRTG
jgi:hypothetical protein